MEKYDPRMARRVWDRVLAQPEQQEDPGRFLPEENQALADYIALARQEPRLKELVRETRQSIAVLRGLQLLMGKSPSAIAAKPRQEPAQTLLRRCVFQCARAAKQYAQCGEEPEFGWVYARLAETRRRHGCILLQILGSAEK